MSWKELKLGLGLGFVVKREGWKGRGVAVATVLSVVDPSSLALSSASASQNARWVTRLSFLHKCECNLHNSTVHYRKKHWLHVHVNLSSMHNVFAFTCRIILYLYSNGPGCFCKEGGEKKTQKGDEHNIACYNLQLKYTNFRQDKWAVHAHNLSQRWWQASERKLCIWFLILDWNWCFASHSITTTNCSINSCIPLLQAAVVLQLMLTKTSII